MADQGIFGDKPFSNGEFGLVDWADNALWQNVPAKHKELDANQVLQQFLVACQGELNAFRALIRDLPKQRDPYACRAQDEVAEWFYVVSCTTEDTDDYGTVVKLIGESSWAKMPNTGSPIPTPVLPYPAWYPYAEITRTGPHWTMIVDDVTYTVVLVQSRNFSKLYYPMDGNQIWVTGGPVLNPQLSYVDPGATYSKYEIGIGDGTSHPSVTLPGLPLRVEKNPDPFLVPPSDPLIADSGISVQLTLTGGGLTTLYDNGIGELWTDDGLGKAMGVKHGTVEYDSARVWLNINSDVVTDGTTIHVSFQTIGRYVRLVPPSMLGYLAQDFGLDLDQYDPEPVQRSFVANVTKYMGMKATQDSYRVLGEISGFNVYVRALYRVFDHSVWLNLPSTRKFEYDGKYYTDIEPRYLLFDDISGDIQYHDPDAGDISLADEALMYNDMSKDGMSTALAFAIDVTQAGVEVLSVTPVTDPVELDTYHIPNGYKVVVQFASATDFAIFNWSLGKFGLTPGYPALQSDTIYWIDGEFPDHAGSWDPGTLQWTVIVGGASSIADDSRFSGFGVVNAAIRYWPTVIESDCAFCRSNKVRVEIEATAQAIANYGTGDDMDRAVGRLEDRIQKLLVPIHLEVIDYCRVVNVTVLGPTPIVTTAISYP